MEFGLKEIFMVIEKVKNEELSFFEYKDGDAKIKIKNGGSCRRKAGLQRDTGAAGLPGNGEAAGLAGNIGAAGLPENAETAGLSGNTGAAGLSENAKAADPGRLILSPMVGTFYSAPAEGEEPFVKEGAAVKKGQTVGIVEAMKLMNEIESQWDGVVEEILVENEQMVEYGQPLIRLRSV